MDEELVQSTPTEAGTENGSHVQTPMRGIMIQKINKRYNNGVPTVTTSLGGQKEPQAITDILKDNPDIDDATMITRCVADNFVGFRTSNTSTTVKESDMIVTYSYSYDGNVDKELILPNNYDVSASTEMQIVSFWTLLSNLYKTHEQHTFRETVYNNLMNGKSYDGTATFTTKAEVITTAESLFGDALLSKAKTLINSENSPLNASRALASLYKESTSLLDNNVKIFNDLDKCFTFIKQVYRNTFDYLKTSVSSSQIHYYNQNGIDTVSKNACNKVQSYSISNIAKYIVNYFSDKNNGRTTSVSRKCVYNVVTYMMGFGVTNAMSNTQKYSSITFFNQPFESCNQKFSDLNVVMGYTMTWGTLNEEQVFMNQASKYTMTDFIKQYYSTNISESEIDMNTFQSEYDLLNVTLQEVWTKTGEDYERNSWYYQTASVGVKIKPKNQEAMAEIMHQEINKKYKTDVVTLNDCVAAVEAAIPGDGNSFTILEEFMFVQSPFKITDANNGQPVSLKNHWQKYWKFNYKYSFYWWFDEEVDFEYCTGQDGAIYVRCINKNDNTFRDIDTAKEIALLNLESYFSKGMKKYVKGAFDIGETVGSNEVVTNA